MITQENQVSSPNKRLRSNFEKPDIIQKKDHVVESRDEGIWFPFEKLLEADR